MDVEILTVSATNKHTGGKLFLYVLEATIQLSKAPGHVVMSAAPA